ncbi:ABC transporter substrate-binding protein [Bradyrhizobium tropiciagri]|uniref:ABC transporter substrate-binding protein n=1 Tax=Bradyrhizobium tropiciagri TaxID=312253 RepID=UPI001BA6F844|nr:ABC transporter substrate-binding protein [Bradyrhizobium tropiciagri]MBR0870325.1 ABC transporter substrate-binding protein [Bradyrhizobium tropiciagri]
MMLSRRDMLAAAAAGLTSVAGPKPAAAQSVRPRVVLGQPSEGFIYLPLYVARKLGYFADEGLDAEIVVFQKGGAEALAAVLGGQADIYVGNPGIQLRAQEKGQAVKSFAAVQSQFGSDLVIAKEAAQRTGMAGLKDPKAKAAALKGLTIAVAGPGSLTDLMVRHIARFGGLDPDRDLTITPIGGGANMLAAYAQKRIDGYALSAPTSTAGVLRFGGLSVFDFAKGEYKPLADIAFYTLIARNDWISGQKDKAQKVVRALWKGLRLMKTSPDEAKAAVRSFFEKTPPDEFTSAWTQNVAAFPATPRITADGMQRNYDFLRDGEGKAVTVPLADSFTNEVVDAVAPSMG